MAVSPEVHNTVSQVLSDRIVLGTHLGECLSRVVAAKKFSKIQLRENDFSKQCFQMTNTNFMLLINLLRPSDAKWRKISVNIVSGNGPLLKGTNPLPAPMLTDYQWGPVTFIWRQFQRWYPGHQSLILHRILLIQNFNQTSLGLMRYYIMASDSMWRCGHWLALFQEVFPKQHQTINSKVLSVKSQPFLFRSLYIHKYSLLSLVCGRAIRINRERYSAIGNDRTP